MAGTENGEPGGRASLQLVRRELALEDALIEKTRVPHEQRVVQRLPARRAQQTVPVVALYSAALLVEICAPHCMYKFEFEYEYWTYTDS